MITQNSARRILFECGAIGDFHALPSAAVDKLLEHANARRYRKPRNAPGSRARMFHAYLTRRAESLTAYAEEASANGGTVWVRGWNGQRARASNGKAERGKV